MNYAQYAMKWEIASKDGNFHRVCPVIGRLRTYRFAGGVCVYRLKLGCSADKSRPFSVFRNDTHGLADKGSRPYPADSQTEYVIKEETPNGKPGNDQNSPEGL